MFESGMRRRNPFIAAFWSILAPGLGLIYCRRIDRAGWYMLAWIAGAGAAVTPLVLDFPAAAAFALLVGAAWVAGLVDTVATAIRVKAVRLAGYNRTALYLAIATVFLGYMFGIAPTLTPARLHIARTAGMEPNIMRGETVLVDRRPVRSAPEPGTVAIVSKQSDPREMLVGRVVAGPGARVAIRAGRLFINGRVIRRDPLLETVGENGETRLPEGKARRFRETLPNGGSYVIFEALGDEGPADSTPEWTVPNGHVFVLGDNRDVALDSRRQAVGFVPLERLRGAPVYVAGSDFRGRLGAALAN